MSFFIWFVLAFALCIVIGMLVAVRNFDNNLKRWPDQQHCSNASQLQQAAQQASGCRDENPDGCDL